MKDDKLYVYGMTERGFSPGCQPKEGLVEAIDDPTDTFYNILFYDRKLTKAEVEQYELKFMVVMNK